jgi:hypothetical protein
MNTINTIKLRLEGNKIFAKSAKSECEIGGVGDGIGYWKTIPYGNKLLPTHWQELPEDPKT